MLLDLLNHAPHVAMMASAHHGQLLADNPTPAPGNGVLGPIGPDKNAPGATAFQSLVGALMFYGLLGGLAGLVLSSMAFGLGRWAGNHHATTAGRAGMLASLAATIVIGGGVTLVNWAFGLGASITA